MKIPIGFPAISFFAGAAMWNPSMEDVTSATTLETISDDDAEVWDPDEICFKISSIAAADSCLAICFVRPDPTATRSPTVTLYLKVGSWTTPMIWISSYLGMRPLRRHSSCRRETGVLETLTSGIEVSPCDNSELSPSMLSSYELLVVHAEVLRFSVTANVFVYILCLTHWKWGSILQIFTLLLNIIWKVFVYHMKCNLTNNLFFLDVLFDLVNDFIDREINFQ